MRHNGDIPFAFPLLQRGIRYGKKQQNREKKHELTWELWGMRVNKTIKVEKKQHTHDDRTRYKHEKHTRIEHQQLICYISLAMYIDAILHHRAATFGLSPYSIHLHTVRLWVSVRTRPLPSTHIRSKASQSSSSHTHSIHVFLGLASDTFIRCFSIAPLNVCIHDKQKKNKNQHQPIQ